MLLKTLINFELEFQFREGQGCLPQQDVLGFTSATLNTDTSKAVEYDFMFKFSFVD